jgi:hypothetical protein
MAAEGNNLRERVKVIRAAKLSASEPAFFNAAVVPAVEVKITTMFSAASFQRR